MMLVHPSLVRCSEAIMVPIKNLKHNYLNISKDKRQQYQSQERKANIKFTTVNSMVITKWCVHKQDGWRRFITVTLEITNKNLLASHEEQLKGIQKPRLKEEIHLAES